MSTNWKVTPFDSAEPIQVSLSALHPGDAFVIDGYVYIFLGRSETLITTEYSSVGFNGKVYKDEKDIVVSV